MSLRVFSSFTAATHTVLMRSFALKSHPSRLFTSSYSYFDINAAPSARAHASVSRSPSPAPTKSLDSHALVASSTPRAKPASTCASTTPNRHERTPSTPFALPHASHASRVALSTAFVALRVARPTARAHVPYFPPPTSSHVLSARSTTASTSPFVISPTMPSTTRSSTPSTHPPSHVASASSPHALAPPSPLASSYARARPIARPTPAHVRAAALRPARPPLV